MYLKIRLLIKQGQKIKRLGNIFEGRKLKKKELQKSVAQGKRNQAATSKMYAAESMFKSAKTEMMQRNPGKKRSFKEAFDAATKAGKAKFMLGGKGYLTTKGKRDNDNMTTRNCR